MPRRRPDYRFGIGYWRSTPRWLRIFARIGYVAKALIYLLMGAIALYEVAQRTGAKSSPMTALTFLRHLPLGGLLLGILAAGFLCYGAHRCIEALFGPIRTPSRLMEIFHRIGRGAGGICYLGFAGLAIDLLVRRHPSTQRGPVLAEHVLRYPLGNIGIMLLGAALAFNGAQFLYSVVSGRFRWSFVLNRHPQWLVVVICVVSVLGISARAVLFLLMGGLTFYSGLSADPSKAKGMQGVLELIERLPLGQWFFAAIAMGFLIYGLFCVTRAIWGIYPSDVGV